LESLLHDAQLPLGAQLTAPPSPDASPTAASCLPPPPPSSSPHANATTMSTIRTRHIPRCYRGVSASGAEFLRPAARWRLVSLVTRFDRFYEPLLVVLLAAVVLWGTL
jgi:hypothetical protein